MLLLALRLCDIGIDYFVALVCAESLLCPRNGIILIRKIMS